MGRWYRGENRTSTLIFNRNITAFAKTSAGVVALGDGRLIEIGLESGKLAVMSQAKVGVGSATIAEDETLLFTDRIPAERRGDDSISTVVALDEDGTFYDLACDDDHVGGRLDVVWTALDHPLARPGFRLEPVPFSSGHRNMDGIRANDLVSGSEMQDIVDRERHERMMNEMHRRSKPPESAHF